MWNPRRISLASDWTPESRVSTPESTRQAIVITLLFAVQGWIPEGVASQKSGPVASDVPRFAPQHTFSARKEPENKGLEFPLSPVRSPLDQKNSSPSSHSVNCLPTSFRPLWTPIWSPARTLGSTTASAPKQKGERAFPAYSPHLAFGIARTCCRCRTEKCCNTLESLTHSVAPQSWSAPAASVAMRSCGRSPYPR